jgi:hypothetical protein
MGPLSPDGTRVFLCSLRAVRACDFMDPQKLSDLLRGEFTPQRVRLGALRWLSPQGGLSFRALPVSARVAFH